MPSFTAPFYGNIHRVSVNPLDNTLWMVTKHPMSRAIAPVKVDVQGLLAGQTVNEATHTYNTPGVSIDVCGHHTGVYVATQEGHVYRHLDGKVSLVLECDAGFEIQAMVAFEDGGAEFPVMTAEGSVHGIAQHNRKVLLIGQASALVIDILEDGQWSVASTLNPTNGHEGRITSWAAETVYTESDSTHHCAFGLSTGVLSAYFTDEDSNNFKAITLMNASEVELSVSMPLHDGAISALVYASEVDRYGSVKRYLISTGLDMRLFQVSLMEGIAIPRKNQHAGQIRAMLRGALASGDGAYRGEKFGRFYTLSDDGTVKAWLNEFTNEAVSTYTAELKTFVGTTMVLQVPHTSGVYGEGEHLGKRFPTPHLVFADANQLIILPLVKQDKSDVLLVDALRDNGRMGGVPTMTLQGGSQYVQKMGMDHESTTVREESLLRFKDWDAQWLMDMLQQIGGDSDFSIGYRDSAIHALASSKHPRRIVLLENMLGRWGNSNDTQKMAYEALKTIDPTSLRPHQVVLNNGGDENKLRVIGDLATVALSKTALSRQALSQLQELVLDSDYDLALRAYDHICGEGDLEPVMSGVEGVLYAIHSSRGDIRREMSVRLANRRLTDTFETTLVLRRLLESSKEEVRERAVDVSLLRARKVSSILRFNDASLHERLYVLENGSFSSTDDREALLNAALPKRSDVDSWTQLFKQEDASVQADLDVLLEFSACSKEDVTVYALQARASFGFEAAAQGLLKLTASSNSNVVRQSVIGLGYMVHLDDAHQRICGITLSKSTSLELGSVCIQYAIKGYELRGEDPVVNVLRKVLDGGNPKLRETAVVIAQQRLNHVMTSLIPSEKPVVKKSEETASTVVKTAKQITEIEQIEKEIQDATDMLELGQQNKSSSIVDIALATLKELNERKATVTGTVAETPVEKSAALSEFTSLKSLLRQVLTGEDLHLNVRREVYKTFWMHNLEDAKRSSDKTPTFTLFLNLRDQNLFEQAVKDLCSHLSEVNDRTWAMSLFKQLIDADIVPEHHSNVRDLWNSVANFAESESFEADILRIGFECSAPCHCKINKNGSSTVCSRHLIRRDAFKRVLSASGDWLAGFIRDAITNRNNGNSSAGTNAAVLAVSDKAKAAVARMRDPSGFILSMLQGTDNAQKSLAYDLLLMYPKFYNEALQEAIYNLRKDSSVVALLSGTAAYHLMTNALFEYFFAELCSGQTQYLFPSIERFAMEKGRSQEFAQALKEQGDIRLIRKALSIAVREYDAWGKNMLDLALQSNDEEARIAFGLLLSRLQRESKRQNNDENIKEFLLKFYQESSVTRQVWVVGALNVTDQSSQWQKDFLKELCGSKVEEIRERGFEILTSLSSQDSWLVDLFKAGLVDANSKVAEISFHGLLATHRLLGAESEKNFLSKTARENKQHQERAVAMALTTTASWRVPFMLEALNDEDPSVRSMMCQQLQSVSGLDDAFFQGLADHKYKEVRSLSSQVLAARGLYRPPSSTLDSLTDTILQAPPTRPRTSEFQNTKGAVDWVRYSNARLMWYWKVKDWKDQKVAAIIAAGKTHDPEYYSTFIKALQSFGYEDSNSSALWENAVSATSWGTEDWFELIVLNIGWVLQESTHIEYAKQKAEKQRSNRLRVVWNVACVRAGVKSSLEWLVDKYYDRSWRNYYRRFIKQEYLFQGLFSVDSSIGFDSETEGPALTIMQRLMNDDTDFVNDIFRLNMLRLAQQGGPVDFIGIGYTSDDEATVLESVQMRERQHNKEELLQGVVSLLNDATIPEKDPYALSNVGGAWYNVVRLTLELHTSTFDTSSEVNIGYWRSIASMVSCRHPQLRARAVIAYFRRTVYGEEKIRFQADVENFSRQLVNTTVNSFPLLQDDKLTSPEKARELAYDAYVGLIRKTDFDLDLRRDALTFVSEMCERASESTKVLPVLKSVVAMDNSVIRFQAYRMLVTLQHNDHALMSLNQLTQIGLRSTDDRLKRMAISLIWDVDQLESTEKIGQLESILKNANDASARHAFDLLSAFTGRPSAWDIADRDKNNSRKQLLSQKQKAVQQLQSEISKIRKDFETFQDAYNQQRYEITDQGVRTQMQAAMAARRQDRDVRIQAIQDQVRAVNVEYEKAVQTVEQTFKSAMSAPLSDADAHAWASANIRKDTLLEMALDAYYSELRTHAVDSGLVELARRRPYFEQNNEEFSGYFERLLGILESALQSPYSDFVQYTAISMAEHQFAQGYKVLLGLLDSHDTSEQQQAIGALLKLGPVGLTQYKDAQGEPLPRTANILLTRVVNDEYGTVRQHQIFRALGELKDCHSSVRQELFAYLNKGVDSTDYDSVLTALLQMTGCRSQILNSTRWGDLTASDFEDLGRYLSYEMDWDQVSLEKFVTLYQDVYDEGLLADIIQNLFTRGDYSNLIGWPNLISMATRTKGFDVQEATNDDEQVEPINDILRKMAMLPNTPEVSSIRSQAITALQKRLNDIEMQCPKGQATRGSIAQILTNVLEANKAVLDSQLLDIACCLATNRCGDFSSTIFEVLYTVSTGQTQPNRWRIQAMKALGYLSDERAVIALLNAAGFDSYGEELLLDPDLPGISSYDIRRLQAAASEALGGMVFAQEREGIYQMLNKMSRSRDSGTRRKGFEGLRYFFRSEKHALAVASLFAERFQSALNSTDSEASFFSEILQNALSPLANEHHSANDEMRIQSETEEVLKQYVLSTFFGEVFEVEGEAFNPLNVEVTVFDDTYSNKTNLESVYAVVRQWVHGVSSTVGNSDDESEQPIDFSHLQSLSLSERRVALKAERKLFENVEVKTRYTNDVTNVLVQYLSPSDLLELVAKASKANFAKQSDTKERYNIMYNGLMCIEPPPIVEALHCLKQDYCVDILGALPTEMYTNIVLDMFKSQLDSLTEHQDAFVDVIEWLHSQLMNAIAKRQFGDTDFEEHRMKHFKVLVSLLQIAQELPPHRTLVKIGADLLEACKFVEGLSFPQDELYKLFELHVESGHMDWALIDRHLTVSDRSLRNVLITHLNTANAVNVLPRVLGWVNDDSAALIRLVDVLQGMQENVQSTVLSLLKDEGTSSSVVLVLSRLRKVEAFKAVVDSFRDEDGNISSEVAIRSPLTAKSTESKRSPLLLETVFNGLAMMATDKAEYYLRDLAEDNRLEYDVRKAAIKAANVAYRRRVPLHIRRAERS